MIKSIFVTVAVQILLSSCEIEYRAGHRYPHAWGWEHSHHPDHHEYYDRGYHHDKDGNEIIGNPPLKEMNH